MYTPHYQKIISLIYRSLIGDLADDDARTLTNWLDESDENRKVYQRLVSGQSREFFAQHFSNIGGAYYIDKIKRNMQRKKRRRILYASSSVAAILIICLLLFVPSFNTGYHPVSEILAEYNAVVTLPGGREVTLSAEEQGKEWLKLVAPTALDSIILGPRTVKVTTARGKKFRLELTDGTVVWLNEETSFEYPDFFAESNREVLLLGEALFDVKNNGNGNFDVMLGDGMKVRVLGTKFNIKSYTDNPEVRISLIEGSVRIANRDNSEIMEPDHEAVMLRGSDNIEIIPVENSAVSGEWIYGLFDFEFRPLTEILSAISERYGLEIIMDRRLMAGYDEVIFQVVRYENPEKVMDILARITGLSYRIEGNKLIITK